MAIDSPGDNRPARPTFAHYRIAAVFIAIVVMLLALQHERTMILSDIRAYVNGEGLYSKAQKRAVIQLFRYARSGSEARFREFQEAMKVPFGGRDARLALLREPPDLGAAAEAFARARNHPDEVERMARFFTRFRNVSFVREAIRIWTEADREIVHLRDLGSELHRLIEGGNVSPQRLDAMLEKISATDDRLTALEDMFSFTLGEGARFMRLVTGYLLFALTAALIVVGWMYSTRVTRDARRVENALRSSESRYRTLSESMIDGLLILREGQFVHANPAALRLLGWTLEELQGTDFAPLIHPDFRALVAERHRRRIAGEALPPRYDIQVVTRAGEAVWVQLANERIDWDGRPAVLTIIADIAERKRAEGAIRSLNETLEAGVQVRTAELKQALEEMESFSYSISHDLRAPLRAINSFTSIVLREHASSLDAEGSRLLGRVSGNALEMARLIDSLLDFARLGRGSLAHEPVDMESLARSVAAELLAADNRHSAELFVGSLPRIDGDERLLRQVWVNLLSNALKFSSRSAGPRIEIGGTPEKGRVVYHVRDNGVGFDMAHATKLFGVFQRLHSEPEFPGTGIGLALVRRIVERHHGRVWAESTPGQGATFYFSLPANR